MVQGHDSPGLSTRGSATIILILNKNYTLRPQFPEKYYSRTGVVAGWGTNWYGQPGYETLPQMHEMKARILWMDQCRNDYGYKPK